MRTASARRVLRFRAGSIAWRPHNRGQAWGGRPTKQNKSPVCWGAPEDEDPRAGQTGRRLQRQDPRQGGRSGVELANVKMSMNPFDEIAVEEAIRLKEKGRRPKSSSSRSGRRRRRRRSAPRSPWAPIAASWSKRPRCDVEPLAVAKILKGIVEPNSRTRHPGQAGDRRRLQPDRPDAGRAARLAAGDVRVQDRA